MIDIREGELPLEELVRGARKGEVGAVVTFLGIVRDDGIQGMEVEAYTEAALEEIGRIKEEALERFEVSSVDVVHRVGRLSVGQDLALIVCAAPHRQAAFQACSYVLEELKARVPIWKKEITGEGERWVKP
ncbi:MAG: molybdenum cofactor biosynthesis protein MoaE [Methanosarcinales archaeon]|nr:molybdenum cofactor biosynthesis protein MoaE [Methanosarcinales archaeon]